MLKAEQKWVQEAAQRIARAAIREAIKPLEARIDKLEKARTYTPTRKTEVKDNAKL